MKVCVHAEYLRPRLVGHFCLEQSGLTAVELGAAACPHLVVGCSAAHCLLASSYGPAQAALCAAELWMVLGVVTVLTSAMLTVTVAVRGCARQDGRMLATGPERMLVILLTTAVVVMGEVAGHRSAHGGPFQQGRLAYERWQSHLQSDLQLQSWS